MEEKLVVMLGSSTKKAQETLPGAMDGTERVCDRVCAYNRRETVIMLFKRNVLIFRNANANAGISIASASVFPVTAT